MTAAVYDAMNLYRNMAEANRWVVDDDSIEAQVQSWYDNSDVVDPEMLAAAALEYGYWRMISYEDWIDLKNKWFCDVPLEYQGYPSISEIESAQRDIEWQEEW